jgi:periplasmic divalent cation tolerance protein
MATEVRMAEGEAVRVVLMTAPDQEVARSLAQALVREHLAACVNLLPGVTSVYHWEGRVSEDAEVLLLAKTTTLRLEALAARVAELHPYELPELVALAPEAVERGYLAWLSTSCAGPREGGA